MAGDEEQRQGGKWDLQGDAHLALVSFARSKKLLGLQRVEGKADNWALCGSGSSASAAGSSSINTAPQLCGMQV